jgi:hypothetical protein
LEPAPATVCPESFFVTTHLDVIAAAIFRSPIAHIITEAAHSASGTTGAPSDWSKGLTKFCIYLTTHGFPSPCIDWFVDVVKGSPCTIKPEEFVYLYKKLPRAYRNIVEE